MTTTHLAPRPRRLVITVCPRERGVVALTVERGGPVKRLDAEAVLSALERVITARGLDDRVTLRRACAGGCLLAGPNVSVVAYPVTPPGEKPDHVAVGWKSYVGSLDTLPCLADVVDDTITTAGRTITAPVRVTAAAGNVPDARDTVTAPDERATRTRAAPSRRR